MSTDAHGFLRGKRLVIFGAGYVGAALARRALQAGASVTALTRNPVTAAALAESGAQAVIADLAADDWHDRIPADAPLVVNCVASGGGGPEAYRRSYVDGLASILRWVRRSDRPGALAYTSSTSVYPQDGGVRVDETAPTGPAEGNAAVLLEAEQRALAWPGRATVLRLAGIYGPGRHHLLDQLRTGTDAVPGVGGYHLNLIHRDDIVEALVCALGAGDTGAERIFNVADDGAATKAEVMAWLAGRLGRPAPTFSGEPAPGRRRITPDRIIANDRLKRVLGWRPRYPTFREGYAALLAEGPANDAGH